MLAGDDGDVRAYLVATLGWLECVVLEARGEDALRHVDEYEDIRLSEFGELRAVWLSYRRQNRYPDRRTRQDG
jgi:hypothetical protein